MRCNVFLVGWLVIQSRRSATSLGRGELWTKSTVLPRSSAITTASGKQSIPPYPFYINSLAPGKFEWNFRHVIFKQILLIDGWGISCEIALLWTSLDFTDDQSTLVQVNYVMAWCRQATSHYLSQWWLRSMSPMASLGFNELKSCHISAKSSQITCNSTISSNSWFCLATKNILKLHITVPFWQVDFPHKEPVS